MKILREPDETEFRIVQVSVGQYINSLAKNRKVIPYDNFKMHRRVNAILSAGYDKICFHYFSKQRLKNKCEYVRPYKALPFFYKVFIT